jgi:uncharacterized 2Fe-2S/4Fe-4S cluster protein (DUF4445 family)
MSRYAVTILPEGTVVPAERGARLDAVVSEAGIPVNLPCGGEGRCGKCAVRVIEGAAEPSPEEGKFLSAREIADGMRLACRAFVTSDMVVDVPVASRVAGTARAWEEIEVVSEAPEAADDLGLAVDLGTTSIAAALVDRASGRVLARASTLNPQAAYGADVIARINAVITDPGALARQQTLAVDAIDALARRLAARLGQSPGAITGMVLAGNPTMEHLLLGIDPAPIARAPFVPAFRDAQVMEAARLGFTHVPEAQAWVFPIISGYVGGDTLAFIWSAAVHESDEMILGLDIGTNGEIVLGRRDRIVTCSAAAGPAFEGAHIRDGMRADFGAIEHVVIDKDAVILTVKGDTKPGGICGSGLVDAVAQMKRARLIDDKGRITADGAPARLTERITKTGGTSEFSLFFDEGKSIGITQKDIREIQLAKGAIHAGCEILLLEMGIGWEDVDRVLVAGAFGNYLKADSIVGVGLLPTSLAGRITFVGDAALTGAVDAALSEDARHEIEALSQRVRYVELSSDRRFADLFVNSLSFTES